MNAAITTVLTVSLLAQAPQPPTIRSRITLVPVDVRVADANGNPITDLKREDFSILEDGKPQEIRLFDARGLLPVTGPPTSASLMRTAATPDPVQAQDRRVFLFVFGRGRHQSADKSIDAVMKFVRERLLPQDRVAVLAFNRATDFTTDRSGVLTTIERYKKAHEQIEADLVQWFSSLRSAYGSKEIPPHIQAEVDAVFRAPGGAAARQLPGAAPTDARAMAEDARKANDTLLRADALAVRDPSPFDAFDNAATELVGMSFDEYAKTSTQSTQDLTNIYTGIRYLRHLDGEKHLVFLTEGGLFLPRLENDHSLAALASDARVVIDVLQTGGMMTMDPIMRDPRTGATLGINANNLARVSPAQFNAAQTSRTVAALTGGMAAVYTPSERTLASIDRLTRFEYLLGYVPSNGDFDGRFRRLTVKVNRPGARVLSRNGYYARRDYVPFDRKEFMTYSRVTAAANNLTPITDLVVTAATDYQDGAAEANLTISIKADRVLFRHENGRHAAAVQFAMFAGDAGQRLLGEHWQTVTFDLTDEQYQKFLAEGAAFSQRIPIAGNLRYVKVIAYDYDADRIGTAVATVRAK